MLLNRASPYPVVGLLAAAISLLAPAILPACPCGPGCMCGPNCQCGPAPQQGPSGPTPFDLRVRKNQSSLSDQERQDFIDAVLLLKSTARPGATSSIYDEFVQLHGASFATGQAHGGPAFLPWHRQLLLDFENQLRQLDPRFQNVTIPYWDFTVDNEPTSSLWSPNFLGGNGDPNANFIVKDGPFAGPSAVGPESNWTLIVDGPDLRRQFGFFVPNLPKPADVEAAFNVGLYDAFPFSEGSPINESFRNNLEGFNHPTAEPELHNRVHAWIGGSSAIIFSPNDPVFWLLHANIDRLWAEWQAAYGLEYVPVEGGRLGHNLNDPMVPFGLTPVTPFVATPASVLDHLALGYRYDTEQVPAEPAVPAPGGLLLAVLGALGLLVYGRRRRRSAGAGANTIVRPA